MVRQGEQIRLGVCQSQFDASELRHGLVVVNVNVGLGGFDSETTVGNCAFFFGESFPRVREVGQDEDQADSELASSC